MSRRSRLSSDDLIEIKALYAKGASWVEISAWLAARGITMNPATIYYHLGLRKEKKPASKRYIDYFREDCARRGVPFENPRARDRKLWS